MRVRVRNVRMLALVLILAFIGQAQAFASVPFQGTGMDAGGFQSTIAADPFHQGVLLSGADVSGFNRSTDTGDTWSLSNGGINDRQLMQTAAIAFSQQTSNKVYSGQGTAGGNGGFVVSTDGGKSWEVRNTSIQFVGGNTKDSSTLPDPHPRSTGNLIALDETNGYIYAGTYKDGVFRSSDDGYTWTYLGLSGSYIRSISLNPADADVLYVAAYGEKLYRMGQAQTSSPSWTQISNSPLYLEELKYIGGKMYAVGGNGSAGKVYRLDFINNANTLTELLSTTGDTIYSAIDGYDGGSQNVIFVGTTNPKANGSMYESVLRSTDGGNVWTAITVNANRIHFEMGTGTNVWWLSQLNPDGMIGKNRFVASYIQVDPFSNNRIYVSGRSGVWKGDIDGSGNVDWHPIVRNMNATFNTAVLADPQQAWRAYVGNTDWGFVYTTDRMENVQANRPATNVDGFALAVDTGTTPSTVYLGTDAGEVYSNPNPN
ncbi:MAG: hypothetical protein K0R75_695, partial [Paenibacillaceae bacterium]|nr:hypothetical protein [Paenibacillaceae bacterium]